MRTTHFSVRVPWREEYTNKICDNPCNNYSCRVLKNIELGMDINKEDEKKGTDVRTDSEYIPPCLKEGGFFLSNEDITLSRTHPYANSKNCQNTHGQFRNQFTNEVFIKKAIPAIPYRWLMLDSKNTFEELNYVDYGISCPGREPTLDFENNWRQNGINQMNIIKEFFSPLKTKDECLKSLIFIYAKDVPYIESNERVIIGISNISSKTDPVQYNSSDPSKMSAYMWETMLTHTIDGTLKNGFILPYKQLFDYADQHEDFDVTDYILTVPREYTSNFSYNSEHVNNDVAIFMVKKAINVINKIIGISHRVGIKGDWQLAIEWLNSSLEELWKERGLYPGLGSMLCTLSIQNGVNIGAEISENIKNEKINLLSYMNRIMSNEDNTFNISGLAKATWRGYPDVFKKYFLVCSRLSITPAQARILVKYDRDRKERIVLNPYEIYEGSIEEENKFDLNIIDNAFFLNDIAKENFIDDNIISNLNDANDIRRIRAFIVKNLTEKASQGHTLSPSELIIRELNNLDIENKFNLGVDSIYALRGEITEKVVFKDYDDLIYIKLDKYDEIDNLIRERVNTFKEDFNEIDEDWKELVNNGIRSENANLDENEINARKEKTKILEKMAKSKIFALTGGAGTGKTKLLQILSNIPQIRSEGILLLAPTGKAKVRMLQNLNNLNNVKAFTIAQFLINNGYDPKTGIYDFQNVDEYRNEQTVIVDECSMLTEEMMAALLNKIKAKRIIFVGDPNQLPPIGAGKPFVDLVNELSSNATIQDGAMCNNWFGELRVVVRQQGNNRKDLEFSRVFMSNSTTNFDFMEDNTLSFVKFDDDNFEEKLFEVLSHNLNINDTESFNYSLTHNDDINERRINNFNNIEHCEDWQILSPTNIRKCGVENINMKIHEKFKSDLIADINSHRPNYELEKPYFPDGYRFILRPFGKEQIVYGDKVINVINKNRNYFTDTFYNSNQGEYIANGEIGIVAGKYYQRTRDTRELLAVGFPNKEHQYFIYKEADFDSSLNSSALELAYALSVHKAQGSQFKIVILVINEPCKLLTREMLYTALTRQEDKVIIMYPNEPRELLKYSDSIYSEIERRFSDLFTSPSMTLDDNDEYRSEGLIHRTKTGKMVRSKGELIIANMLYDNHIKFDYEKVINENGIELRPDFTLYKENGDRIIWEHLGMLDCPKYKKRWAEKEKLYKTLNIKEELGNLIITKDTKETGFDSQKIEKLILDMKNIKKID